MGVDEVVGEPGCLGPLDHAFGERGHERGHVGDRDLGWGPGVEVHDGVAGPGPHHVGLGGVGAPGEDGDVDTPPRHGPGELVDVDVHATGAPAPRLQERVRESADPFETALRIAIAGNIMDWGARHHTRLSDRVVEETVASDHRPVLLELELLPADPTVPLERTQ